MHIWLSLLEVSMWGSEGYEVCAASTVGASKLRIESIIGRMNGWFSSLYY